MLGEVGADGVLASWFAFWVVIIRGQGRTIASGAGLLRGCSKSGRVPLPTEVRLVPRGYANQRISGGTWAAESFCNQRRSTFCPDPVVVGKRKMKYKRGSILMGTEGIHNC